MQQNYPGRLLKKSEVLISPDMVIGHAWKSFLNWSSPAPNIQTEMHFEKDAKEVNYFSNFDYAWT